MIRLSILGAGLPLSFRTFQFFPGMGLVHEAWFVLVALALVVIYLPWRLRQGGHPRSLEAYVLTLMVVIPFWSAFAAQREFGQPLIYGLLAQRGIVLVAGVPLLIYQGLASRIISMKDLERTLVFLAWSTMALFLAMSLALDAGSYFAAYGRTFVTGPGKEAMFVFNPVFIVFGFYYYALKGFRCRSLQDYYRSGAFFLFLLIIIQGRSLLLSLLVAFFLLAILWTPNRTRLVGFLAKATLTVSLAWAALYFLNQELYASLLSKFTDAFTVLFTGELTDDASANARITQTILAMPYLERHLAFGNGIVSHQWNGGFETAISGYFYPDDIGILGVVFLYGILGTLLYLYVFKLAFAFSHNDYTKCMDQRSFLDATKGIILFYGIRSLATAQFVFTPEPLVFFIGVLWVTSIEASTRYRRTSALQKQ